LHKTILKSKNSSSKNYPILVVVILLVFDVIGIYLSFLLAAEIRRLLIPWFGGSVYWPGYQNIVLLGLLSSIGILFFSGLYPGYGLTAVVELEKITKSLTLIFVFLGIAIYFLKVEIDFPRSIFLFALILSIVIVSLFHLILRNRLSLLSFYGISVLFLIDPADDGSAIRSVHRCRRMGWNIVVVYIYGGGSGHNLDDTFPIINTWEEMEDIQEKNNIETVIISNQILRVKDNDQKMILGKLTNIFNNVVVVMQELNLGSVWVKPRDLEGYLGLEINYQLLEPYKRFIKEGTNYIGGVILLFILSPLIFIISLLIFIDDPGPVFFRQERLGKNFKPFQTYKFRSMEVNAEQKLAELLESDPASREEYRIYKKLQNDPRITRIGKILRKFSLDELPQILNVVRGEMSLVGPRAYIPNELDDYKELAELILIVKPGMTGWWQVMGRNALTFEGRLRQDEYYISNWSLWLDSYIILRTVWVVLSGQGK